MKTKKSKRLLAIVLCVALLLTMGTITALALSKPTTYDALKLAVKKGGEIKLGTTMAADSDLVIDKDVTIDLNGQKILMGEDYTITIKAKAGEKAPAVKFIDTADTKGAILSQLTYKEENKKLATILIESGKVTVDCKIVLVGTGAPEGENMAAISAVASENDKAILHIQENAYISAQGANAIYAKNLNSIVRVYGGRIESFDKSTIFLYGGLCVIKDGIIVAAPTNKAVQTKVITTDIADEVAQKFCDIQGGYFACSEDGFGECVNIYSGYFVKMPDYDVLDLTKEELSEPIHKLGFEFKYKLKLDIELIYEIAATIDPPAAGDAIPYEEYTKILKFDILGVSTSAAFCKETADGYVECDPNVDKTFDANTKYIYRITLSGLFEREYDDVLGILDTFVYLDRFDRGIIKLTNKDNGKVSIIRPAFVTGGVVFDFIPLEIVVFDPASPEGPIQGETTTKEETTKPETTKPETTKPETTKPETTKPETTKPETTKPETTKPETTKPETTKPETTKPETTKPETTKPETTKPETTKPETTKPETTKPETTKPETTKPETTKPETTKPETTKPETTKPETTKPDTTKPVDTTKPAGTTIPQTTKPADITGTTKPAGTTVPETVKPDLTTTEPSLDDTTTVIAGGETDKTDTTKTDTTKPADKDEAPNTGAVSLLAVAVAGAIGVGGVIVSKKKKK